MKVDLSCPVELRSYELISDDAGHTRANICLYNLSARRVSGFEAVAHWLDSRSGASAAVPFAIDRMRAGARSFFNITLTAAAGKADHVGLNFTRVCFEDGEHEWRAGDGPVTEVSEILPLPGPEQNSLLAAAGEDAVRFAAEENGVWRCVCGRANPRGQVQCVRCLRRFEDLFPALTREAVLESGVHAELAAEVDDLPLAARGEKRRNALRRRVRAERRAAIFRGAVGTLAAAAALTGAAFAFLS